jgi:hypothetical protein
MDREMERQIPPSADKLVEVPPGYPPSGQMES